MTEPGLPTLDQLRIFLAVVDSGSFAGAARQLNRAVSVISYGIANLEAQLGLILFDREGTRRPILTEAGRAMLAEARGIAQGVDGLRAKAKGMLQGLEAEVSIAVDVMVPTVSVARVLHHFQQTYPTVALRVHIEAMGAINAAVIERRAVIAIAGPIATEAQEIESMALRSIPMIPVASPDHPLGRAETLLPGAARDHIQLVLTDRSRLTEGRDFQVRSARTWRLGDLGAKHALLREGIGWGNMPLHMVRDDLDSGALKRLVMPDHPGGDYQLFGIWRRDEPPGPAASWLLHQFADYAARVDDAGNLAPNPV